VKINKLNLYIIYRPGSSKNQQITANWLETELKTPVKSTHKSIKASSKFDNCTEHFEYFVFFSNRYAHTYFCDKLKKTFHSKTKNLNQRGLFTSKNLPFVPV